MPRYGKGLEGEEQAQQLHVSPVHSLDAAPGSTSGDEPMTLDREHHIKRIVPASPKAFRTIIEEHRQKIIEGMDLKAEQRTEAPHQNEGE